MRSIFRFRKVVPLGIYQLSTILLIFNRAFWSLYSFYGQYFSLFLVKHKTLTKTFDTSLHVLSAFLEVDTFLSML